MSNEELARAYQRGDQSAAKKLWEQCGGFLYRVYEKYFPLCPRCRCEPEDLLQTGYFAVLDAARTFDPEQGGFLGWLAFYARKAALDTLGLRKRQKPVLLSLDVSMTSEDDGIALADTLPDQSATDAFEAVEDALHDQYVHGVVDACLARQPELVRRAIQGRYWERKAAKEIAGECGASVDMIYSKHVDGLRALHRNARIRELEEYYHAPYRYGTGLSSFRYSGSSVERAAILREALSKELDKT